MSAAPSRASKWSKRVREIIPDFLHVLDSDQKFLYASPSCKTITQYEPTALAGRPVIHFIHPDDHDLFLRELEYSRLFKTPVRFFYRFHMLGAHWTILDCQAQWHADYQMDGALPPPHIAAHQGYLLVSRPYLNETTALWDSFLEATIEQVRLTRRIAELREEQDDQETLIDSIEVVDTPLIAIKRQNNSNTKTDVTSSPLKGDCGIALPQLKSAKNPAPKRKARRVGEPRRCSTCDTKVSPEWRNGPQGPKTLCNACGLRWAKRLKAAEQSMLLEA